MKKLSYSTIISHVIKEFDSYDKTEEYKNNDPDLPYSFFYGFSEYILSLIEKLDNPTQDLVVKRAYDLFNSMISSEDENVATLVVTEVLPNMVQSKKGKAVTIELLDAPGQDYLKEVLKYTGI